MRVKLLAVFVLSILASDRNKRDKHVCYSFSNNPNREVSRVEIYESSSDGKFCRQVRDTAYAGIGTNALADKYRSSYGAVGARLTHLPLARGGPGWSTKQMFEAASNDGKKHIVRISSEKKQ